MIKLNEIKSVSIDMSTEKKPYNRIYAKTIEKQGDVLLCEFESANYDINKKGKDFTTGISEEMYLDQLKVKENMIKSYQEENAKLKEIIEKDKKTFAESRIYPAHLISEDFPVKYDVDKLKDLLKDARNVLKMVDTYYGDYDSTKGFLIVERIDEVLNG